MEKIIDKYNNKYYSNFHAYISTQLKHKRYSQTKNDTLKQKVNNQQNVEVGPIYMESEIILIKNLLTFFKFQ